MERPKDMEKLVQFELNRGNVVIATETGWTKMMFVYRMKNPISTEGQKLAETLNLEFTKFEGSPHDPAGDIYSFKAHAIEFPI